MVHPIGRLSQPRFEGLVWDRKLYSKVREVHQHILQRLGERSLPVDGLAHLNATSEEDRRRIELGPHWLCEGLYRFVGWYAVDCWCSHR